MGTTYSPSNIGAQTKDRVRWRVGDVNGKPQWFLQDEEINALLATQRYPDGTIDFDEVCAECAESIGAQCIQLADSVAQRNLKISYQNRANQAFALADRLRDKGKLPPGSPLETGAQSGTIDSDLPCAYDILLGDQPLVFGSPFDREPY